MCVQVLQMLNEELVRVGLEPLASEQETATFSQSGRWYRYKTKQWAIPKKEVVEHSANMHIIPSTAELESKLNAIVVGQVINLAGSLVHIKAQDGWKWKSSMTRKDSGAGSCEVIWLTSLELD